jgi:dTDP-4-amino-4,6-dideoxygalactose transaminase
MITVTKSSLPELEKYLEYLKRIWSTRWLTNDGEFTQLLEEKLKAYLKVKNLALVCNGTLALHLALKALDLKGEVVTTPFTFMATTNVIVWERLKPVFADIDPQTFNIDPAEVEQKITEKTSAILAVHVYGNPCRMEELQEIASKHDLKLIFDSAHAFGVEYKNKSVLDYGDLSTLSFHATKVFNTIEGGAIVSAKEELIETLKLLRNHGIKSEEEVALAGTNAKMNEFQAAMGLCNLENLDSNLQLRKKLYDEYKERLGCERVRFQEITASKYNFSYMPVCFESGRIRNEVSDELLRKGIKSRKYFFPLTVKADYFREKTQDLANKSGLDVASSVSDRILCLPLYPDLDTSTVEQIVKVIFQVLENN